MAVKVQKISFDLGMDSDSDYPRIKQGMYLRADNMRPSGQQPNQSRSQSIVLGNTLKYSLQPVVVQSQTVRIYFTVNGNNETFGFQIFDWNTQPLMNVAATIVTAKTDVATTITNFQSNVGGLLTLFGQGYTWSNVQTNGLSGSVDLTVTTVAGRVYFTTYTFTDTTFEGRYYTKTIYEAISADQAGDPVMIGGKEFLGRAYSFWTTTSNNEVDIAATNPIFAIRSSGVANLIQIQFTNPTGFTDGEAVVVSDMITDPHSTSNINGYWIISIVDPFTVNLLGSIFSGLVGLNFSNASVGRYPFGYSLIHAAERDENDQTYAHAVLLRTRELDFRQQHQIDCDLEFINQYNVYFTDDFNTIRVFYYTGDIITDGAIKALNPTGAYSYGSINTATQLLIGQPDITLTFTGQAQSGGKNIPVGNHQAAVRLVTATDNTATLWTALDNPVPTYNHTFFNSPQNNNSEFVSGNGDINNVCAKRNQYRVEGIDTSIYKYLDLADVVYTGLSFTAIIVTRILITGSTMDIEYNGNESDTLPLPAGDLAQLQAAYVKAKNIRILDNRLVISNLTARFHYDLTAWALGIEYTLFKKALDEDLPNNTNKFPAEFADPSVVNTSMGHMLNDQYRFAVQVRDKVSGIWSDSYYVTDVRFDLDLSDPRKHLDASFSNYDITLPLTPLFGDNCFPAHACQVLVPYIQFNYRVDNFFLSDGQLLSDVFDAVRFVRAPCIPEVKASGIIVQGVYQLCNGKDGYGDNANYGYTNQYGEFPFATGWKSPSINENGTGTGYYDWIGSNPAYPNGGSSGFANSTNPDAYKLCSFYSPDIELGGSFNNHEANNDSLYIINAPRGVYTTDHQSTIIVNSLFGFLPSTFRFIDAANGNNTIAKYTIDDSLFIGTGGQGTFSNGDIFQKQVVGASGTPPRTGTLILTTNFLGSPVFLVDSAITPTSGGVGILYGQWFRLLVNKYGNQNSTKYITTGHFRDLSLGSVGTLNDDVFGGDTFTQHTYLKIRLPVASTFDPPSPIASQDLGGNGVIKFYSQNRINSQLRNATGQQALGTAVVFPTDYEGAQVEGNGAPQTTFQAKMNNFMDLNCYDYGSYNQGFSREGAGKPVVNYIAFDPNLVYLTQYPYRAAWSNLKPNGSLTDLFRIFSPFDFHDLDGTVTHHEKVNGELFSATADSYYRQYFNTRGTLQVQNVSEVLIGDGTVMSRDGQYLSGAGSIHKWSFVKGKSKEGKKDALYWWDVNLKKIMRFSADGTRCLSDEAEFQVFIANNTRFVYDFDTPAFNYGICGVFDNRNNEVVWTVRGQRQNVPLWQPNGLYLKGAVVKFIPPIFSTYEKTGEFYVYKQQFARRGEQPDISPDFWQLVSHDDPNYYNEYTLVYNEDTNKFTAFYLPKPKIYMEYKDTYLSPDPINSNTVYEHNTGNYAEWYAGDNGDAHLKMVYAGEGDLMKLFHALDMNILLKPSRIDFYTESQHTFILDNDVNMEQPKVSDMIAAAIKNDILTDPNGSADGDTDKLNGKYLIIDITLPHGSIYNKITSLEVKFSALERIFAH